VDLFDVVGDVVDSVQDGGRNFASGALEFFQRMGNLDETSLGPSLLDKAGFVVDNPLVKIAGSPILAAAQGMILAMKATTGSGEPEDGEGYKTSAEKLDEAGETLVDAAPDDDLWDGTASEAYRDKNGKHRHLTFEVGYADHDIHGILQREAEQVTRTRESLGDLSDFLADFDTATSWLGFVPGGGAVKAAMDMAMAATQVGQAEFHIAKLGLDSARNAGEVRAQIDAYTQAAALEMFDETDCAPFGIEERRDRTRPRRAVEERYIPVEGPPVSYPPATPYESPTTPPIAPALPPPAAPAPSAPAPARPVAPAPVAPTSAAPTPAAPKPGPSPGAPVASRPTPSVQSRAPVAQGAQSGLSNSGRAPAVSAAQVEPPANRKPQGE
jgi:hypothetical protein